MTIEEAQKVLDELDNVKPELLNDEAKRLFETIMTIADERDEMKKENELAKQALKEQCDIADERNQLLKENAFLKGRADALIRIKKDLEKQRDYYKARYLEFNDAFIKKEDK